MKRIKGFSHLYFHNSIQAIFIPFRILRNYLEDKSDSSSYILLHLNLFLLTGLECAEIIKTEFDQRWSPHWHVIIGRNFGSFVTHETKSFIYFYLGDKAIMIFKAG